MVMKYITCLIHPLFTVYWIEIRMETWSMGVLCGRGRGIVPQV